MTGAVVVSGVVVESGITVSGVEVGVVSGVDVPPVMTSTTVLTIF